jgi:hypothetical protein
MTSTTPILPGTASNPAAPYPRPPAPDPPAYQQEGHKHAAPHHTFTVPQIKIPMLKATMDTAPTAKVKALQLLAGLLMPANLGLNIYTSA